MGFSDIDGLGDSSCDIGATGECFAYIFLW